MPSAIDETKPIPLEPTTASVRDNFAIAKAEISELQARGPFLPLVSGNALLTGGWFVVRHGANPGLTIENTGAAPTFALQVGGNPAVLWFRTVNSATNAPVANLAAISSTGKFSVLGGASDPFELTVPSGMSARAWFTITGNRTWSVGPRADGAFEIGDQTGQIGRMVIGTGGLMQYFGSVNVNGVLTVAGTGLGAPLPPGDEGVVLPAMLPALDDLPETRTTAGDRIILYADVGPFDFTIGISGGTMWFGNRGVADAFAWYAGPVQIGNLSGAGVFNVTGGFTVNGVPVATQDAIDALAAQIAAIRDQLATGTLPAEPGDSDQGSNEDGTV